ncbi:MAG: DedA family protein [Candidatus Yanofskybacteria bacterium]|nr:DedA family protein [Candidatus Yanofskybacteria bacterium]
MDQIVGGITNFILSVIDTGGYAGIFVLMALEGSFFPLPSEIILPFSGYLVAQERFSLWMVALVGALGNIAGTLFSYSVARYLGLPFLYKYGKYMFVTRHDIDQAWRVFQKYGIPIIFFSRLIPGLRGFIPIPAGVARMRVLPFILYVFVGSFLYSAVLTYLGVVVGENWDTMSAYFKQVDILVLIAATLFITWWVRRHIRLIRQERHMQNHE